MTKPLEAYIDEIRGQPSEYLTRAIEAMTKAHDSHKLAKITLEAKHRQRVDLIKEGYAKDKTAINKSILELEKQLSELRVRWGDMCDAELKDVADAVAEFDRQQAASQKILKADQAMLEVLKAD